MSVHVVLTATVRPNVTSLVTITDPDVRRRQYQRAIARWSGLLDATDIEMHILETSGAQERDLLAEVSPGARKRIKFQAIDGGGLSTERGKGAVEFQALQNYFASARLLDDEGTIYKVTGRLFVANAKELLTPISPNGYRVRGTVDGTFVDTRLIGASSPLWAGLVRDVSSGADDNRGIYAEHIAALTIHRNVALANARREVFARRPQFDGVSGSLGMSYKRSRLNGRLGSTVEARIRRFAARKQV